MMPIPWAYLRARALQGLFLQRIPRPTPLFSTFPTSVKFGAQGFFLKGQVESVNFFFFFFFGKAKSELSFGSTSLVWGCELF